MMSLPTSASTRLMELGSQPWGTLSWRKRPRLILEPETIKLLSLLFHTGGNLIRSGERFLLWEQRHYRSEHLSRKRHCHGYAFSFGHGQVRYFDHQRIAGAGAGWVVGLDEYGLHS